MARETSWAIVDSKTLLVYLLDQILIDLLIIHTFHATVYPIVIHTDYLLIRRLQNHNPAIYL